MSALWRPEPIVVIVWTKLTQQTIWIINLATNYLSVAINTCHLVLRGVQSRRKNPFFVLVQGKTGTCLRSFSKIPKLNHLV